MHDNSLKAQKTTKERVESLRKKLDESTKDGQELCGKVDMGLTARTEAKLLFLSIKYGCTCVDFALQWLSNQ